MISCVLVEGVDFGAPPCLLPAAQVRRLLQPGDIICHHDHRSGRDHGIVWNDDGSVQFTREGNFIIHRPTTSKANLRTAQLICGLLGLVLINVVMLYTPGSREDVLKDFTINFASDMMAVASILLMAELVDRNRTTRNAGDPTHEARDRTVMSMVDDD